MGLVWLEGLEFYVLSIKVYKYICVRAKVLGIPDSPDLEVENLRI